MYIFGADIPIGGAIFTIMGFASFGFHTTTVPDSKAMWISVASVFICEVVAMLLFCFHYAFDKE